MLIHGSQIWHYKGGRNAVAVSRNEMISCSKKTCNQTEGVLTEYTEDELNKLSN